METKEKLRLEIEGLEHMKSVNGLSEMGLGFLKKQKEKFNKLTKEGKKTLSDMVMTLAYPIAGDSSGYSEVHTKEKIKEFIDWCINSPHDVKLPSIAVFKDKAKEIFGDKLTKG